MENAPAAPQRPFLMGFLMLDLAPSKTHLSAGQQARPSVCG
jgi:hypothetical protein